MEINLLDAKANIDYNNASKMLELRSTQVINKEKALKFLKLAKYQADLFSKDTTKVGCIFIDKDNYSILSCGYNGFIRGAPEPYERWERPEKYQYVLHGEMNSITNAARCGIKLDESIAFVTMFPCNDCMKALLQVGISTLVSIEPNLKDSKWSESFKISQIMLNESNIKVILFSNDDLNTWLHIICTILKKKNRLRKS